MLVLLFALLSFGLFYYHTRIKPISPAQECLFILTSGILAAGSVYFNQNKFVHCIYYLFLLFSSLISFASVKTVFLAVLFYLMVGVLLLLTSRDYWIEEMKELRYAIKKAAHFMGTGRYPLGVNIKEVERQLEFAILFGVGESFIEHYAQDEKLLAISLEDSLWRNPRRSVDSLGPHNLIYFTAYQTGSRSSEFVTTSSTSSTGGGGAGAF